MTSHAPPHDLDAERAVLGVALAGTPAATAALDAATTILTGSHFHSPAHETIWHTLTLLADQGTDPDTLTVTNHLRATGHLDQVGGPSYLHALAQTAANPGNITWHAQIVRDHHTRRTIAATGHRLATLTDTDDPTDALDQARATLDAAAADTTTPVPHDQAVHDALASLDDPPGTPTPWHHLTHAIAGWKPGELYIVGARPAVGKTVLGANITLDAARRGLTCPLFSLEMTRNELILRLLSNIASVDGSRIQHRSLSPEDRERLTDAAHHLRGLPVVVDDRAALSVAQIRSRLRTLARTEALGPVVIDYLGLLKPPAGTPREDRRVQVDAISRSLKELAKSLHVPVVALAQLNRGPEARADKIPHLSDLREAGGQEQDADVVMLLHRDITGQDADPSELHVVVAKNRHGPATRLTLDFAGHYSRATQRGWGPTPPTAYTERTAS